MIRNLRGNLRKMEEKAELPKGEQNKYGEWASKEKFKGRGRALGYVSKWEG